MTTPATALPVPATPTAPATLPTPAVATPVPVAPPTTTPPPAPQQRPQRQPRTAPAPQSHLTVDDDDDGGERRTEPSVPRVIWVSLILFGLGLIVLLFGGIAVYRSMPDSAEITATVITKVTEDIDSKFLPLETKVDDVVKAQTEAQKVGDPQKVAELSKRLDDQLAEGKKTQAETTDRLDKVEASNQNTMEFLKGKLGEIQTELANARQPVPVTPPPTPPAVAEETANQNGSVQVEFVPYDPSRHVYKAPVSTQETTHSGDGGFIEFDVSNNPDTVRVRGDKVVLARPVVLKDGSRLHDQGFTPKLMDKKLTAYKLDIQMDKDGKVFRTYWFAK